MRKILTFLFAALMSVGMWADPTVVTWNSSDMPSSGSGDSFTHGGVTLTCDDIMWIVKYVTSPGTFTTDLGYFTKIEITADECDQSGDGWAGSTWEGNAASVSFDWDIDGLTQIVFTIDDEAPATVAVTGVTLNQNEAAMTVGGETLTLTATVNPEGATDKSVTWSTSDANVAIVDNGVVTAVAVGTATITVTTTDGSYTATCDVTVTAPAPTPNSITINESSNGSVVASSSSAAAGETITLTATPDDGYQLKSISGVLVPETINSVNQQATVTGTNFHCVGTMNANLYGWRVYNSETAQTLTVSSLNGTTLIKKIEFTATQGNQRKNNMLSVSAGTLSFDGNDPSTTVTINDINATLVTISGSGTNNAQTWYINSVRVYTEEELEISDTENANVKTFTMVNAQVTISAEFEPVPTGFDITANLDPQNDGVYYSTFYDGSVDYALPANVKAYKAVISGSNLLLSEVAVEGDVLPKGNAVILRSSVQNYTLTPSDATPVSVGDDNDLEGVDAITAVTSIDGLTTTNCYVLSGTNENGVGFYRINSENLKAHKAYVKYSGTQNNAPRRMRFVFEQENTTTGMENVQGDNVQSTKVLENGVLYIIKNGVRYNAQGQIVK